MNMLNKKVTWWNGSWHGKYIIHNVNKKTVLISVADKPDEKVTVPREEVCYGWVDTYDELLYHFDKNKV